LRRRDVRVLAAIRGGLEDQRLERLYKLHDTIRTLKNLPEEEKKRVTRKLRLIMERVQTKTPTAIQESEPQVGVGVQATPADIIGLLLTLEEPGPATHSLGPPVEQQVQPKETEKINLSVPVSHDVPPTTSLPRILSGDTEAKPSIMTPQMEQQSLEEISDTLTELYKEYQDSITTFNSVITSSEYPFAAAGDVPIFRSSTMGQSGDPNDKGRTDGSSEPMSGESSEEPSVILRASKHQVELTDMESEAWSLLSSAASTLSPTLRGDGAATTNLSPSDQRLRDTSADQSPATSPAGGEATTGIEGTTSYAMDGPEGAAPSTSAQFVEQAEETFHNVEQRSRAIAASYKLRTDAPTDQTYREARSLLQAMGVPVVVTEGGEEAEAVASALVLEGSADYVASEDTVSNPWL
jgi:hypothetical protein